MHRTFLRVAALLGAASVALGAFGAHALKEKVPANAAAIFETAVRYQVYHVLALALAGVLYQHLANKWMRWAGNLFITGIALFSGSLYILTFTTAAGNAGLNWIGAITPLGGLALIAGWLCLFMGVSAGAKT